MNGFWCDMSPQSESGGKDPAIKRLGQPTCFVVSISDAGISRVGGVRSEKGQSVGVWGTAHLPHVLHCNCTFGP